jgi:hypothetical protein
METTDGIRFIIEFCEKTINRQFFENEKIQLLSTINDYKIRSLHDSGIEDEEMCFSINCSPCGILLVGGLGGYLFEKNITFYPFFSVIGFGVVPSFLPQCNRDAIKYINFAGDFGDIE